MSSPRSRLGPAAAATALVLLGGCTVSQPDAAAWQDHARQALDDVASEVATARLALTQLDEGRLPAAYGVTVLADAEQDLATAEEGLATLQPPAGMGTRAERLLALIGHAADAVQEAREAAVAEKYGDPALICELERLHTALDRRRAAM